MIAGLTFALLGACTNDSPTEIPADILAPAAAVVPADNVDDLRITAATDSSITVSWTQVHNGARKPANYRLKFATPPINWSTATIGCAPTMLGTKVGATMSCTVQGLAVGTTYDFQLMSFRIVSGGAWAGAVYSNIATGATTTTGATAVDDLSLASSTTSTLTVRWTQVDDGSGGPASYRVKHAAPPIAWSTAQADCGDIAGTQIGALASCTITGLPPSTTHDVQLMSYRVVNGTWLGAAASNVTTGLTATPNASPVADLSVTAATDSSLTVRWTQVGDGTGSPALYSVKYARPSLVWSTATVGCNPAPAATQVGATLSCTVSGLAASTGYEVQVMSYRGTSGAPQGAAYSNLAAGQTAAAAPVAPTSGAGIWISQAEIAQLPTSGAAWNDLLSEANSSCGVVNLVDQEQTNNVCIMAKALVFARTGTASYRSDVVTALTQVVNSGVYGGRALALGRELAAYVIAADLISLETHNAALDILFRTKIRALLTAPTTEAGTLQQCHERRPNNWGTHCGASRAAVAAYLGDTAELDRVATVFRGWLGDRAAYAGFSYGDLSWQCNSASPVGINPAGCTRNGASIDGVIADDQRRAGGFTWPAPQENYVWEALQGALAQAVILDRAGYPVWDWQNRALLRAVTWLHNVNNYPAEGDDEWQAHVINHYYGTNFPAPIPARAGKNVGWTAWTHR